MTAPLFSHGQWRRDATIDDIAAEVISNPMWHFADDPMSFIGWCTIEATYVPMPRRAFWVELGVLLVRAANNPHVRAGAILGQMASDLGISC